MSKQKSLGAPAPAPAPAAAKALFIWGGSKRSLCTAGTGRLAPNEASDPMLTIPPPVCRFSLLRKSRLINSRQYRSGEIVVLLLLLVSLLLLLLLLLLEEEEEGSPARRVARWVRRMRE